jgi:hypothetical protein
MWLQAHSRWCAYIACVVDMFLQQTFSRELASLNKPATFGFAIQTKFTSWHYKASRSLKFGWGCRDFGLPGA